MRRRKKLGFFSKIAEGLKKTRDAMSSSLANVFKGKVDDDLFDELEEALILSDTGATTAFEICDELRKRVKKEGTEDSERVKEMLSEVIEEIISGDSELHIENAPAIIMLIGVNGAGKTTTAGKLAKRLSEEGKKVIIAAADTFRAAAAEQLDVWAERSGCDLIRHQEGSDPAAVVYDAIAAGKARHADVIICDTAGRLHTKKGLMDELAKIGRIIEKESANSSVETLLVLDGTTGQNALSQAKEFGTACGITGIVLTKLDGTARGGVIIGIRKELGYPVKYIGIGEQAEDLMPFDPKAFSKALFEREKTDE